MVSLHVCCGDCLLRYLVAMGYPLPEKAWGLVKDYRQLKKYVAPNWQTIELYFDNNNIYPQAEHTARLLAVKKVAGLVGLPLKIANYRPQNYFSLPACQLTLAGKKTKRCRECQITRLKSCLEFALRAGLPDERGRKYSSTMLVSPFLDTGEIAKNGSSLARDQEDLEFLVPKWKIDPHKIKTTGFFKQNYCGCLFSLIDKTQEKYGQLLGD